VARSATRPAAPSRVNNDTVLVGAMVAYGVVLVALALTRGVELTPAVVAIAAALLAVLALRRHMPLRDWVPFVVIALGYELIRGYQATLYAMVHVTGVIDLERSLLGGNLATAVLQSAFHPAHGPDVVAILATILYVLHVPLPLAVAAFLWFRHRSAFADYVAAMVVLSIAAFITYLLLPVAPPWWAAAHGYMQGPGGHPLITYLQPPAFTSIIDSAGFDGHALLILVFGGISPDPIASFPSIHAAYPFLAYLFARRVLGRARWAVLAYAGAAWFAIVYLGDHYAVDVIGGIAYASAAYWAVSGGPRALARLCSRYGGVALSRWLPVGSGHGGAPG
jgi:PAP2 superfamily